MKKQFLAILLLTILFVLAVRIGGGYAISATRPIAFQPTGTGVFKNVSGSEQAAASAVDLGTTDVTGVLTKGNGGTGTDGGAIVAFPTSAFPVDGNTIVWWDFRDGDAGAANYGDSGALPLSTVYGGTPITQTPGAPGLTYAVNSCSAAAVCGYEGTASPASIGESTTALTWSAWVFNYGWNGNANTFIGKNWNTGTTWSAPYGFTFQLDSAGGGTGTLTFAFIVGGVQSSVNSGLIVGALGAWQFYAATYDNATARVYLNGVQVGSLAKVGPLDFGSHGPWFIGGTPGGTTWDCHCKISDVRIENTVRSAAYLLNYYRTQMPLYQALQ